MTKDSDNHSFEPEIVIEPETGAGKEQESAGGTSGDLILASASLPDRIFVLPNNSKPIFPGLVVPIMLSPGRTADLLKRVVNQVRERIFGIVMTREQGVDLEQGAVSEDQIYRIGTAVRVLKFQEGSDGGLQALLQGEQRFQILKTVTRDGLLVAQVVYLQDMPPSEDADTKASSMAIIKTMRELMRHNPIYSEEIKMFLSRQDWDTPGRLADFAATMTSAKREELQDVLETLAVNERQEKVLFMLRKELDLNELKEKITRQIEERISKQQREFFLREQLKAIKQELGLEKDGRTEEIEKYQARLEQLTLPEEARVRIDEEIDKLRVLMPQSPEYTVSRNYLDWLTGLPWGEFSKDLLEVSRARRVLNRDHYGLEDVKKRILEFIAVARLRGAVEGSILCLIGPPGVGKTSLGHAVAEALGREFFRFSLGGMRDEAEIKGHRRTYIGAMPGKVMQAIKNVGVANPVVMLDEIDKVGKSFQGDPASALLEVLDPEQNNNFRDHYLDVPFDLSKVLFIATANVPDTIPGPLIDRMEMIHLSGYIMEDKLSIAKRHLMPRLLRRNGLDRKDVRFTNGALRKIIDGYAREAGVRALEKSLNACLRKVATGRAEGDDEAEQERTQVAITQKQVEVYLGKPRFGDEAMMKRLRPGVAVGLAWTPLGGAVLHVEAMEVPADERSIKLTGQLGEVMVESSHIAFSLVGGNCRKWGVEEDFFERKTVHLHVPAGATPKDGPSAGITMAVALLSLGRRQSIPPRLAMTGELTLVGRVLEVGGIREKIIAAKRARIQQVILPAGNEKDFIEIPERVRAGITPHYVSDFRQIFDLVFKPTGNCEMQIS